MKFLSRSGVVYLDLVVFHQTTEAQTGTEPVDARVYRMFIKVPARNTSCSICETKVKVTRNKVTNIGSNPLTLLLDCILRQRLPASEKRLSSSSSRHGISGVILPPA